MAQESLKPLLAYSIYHKRKLIHYWIEYKGDQMTTIHKVGLEMKPFLVYDPAATVCQHCARLIKDYE